MAEAEASNWLLAAVLNPADLDGLDGTSMVLGASYANKLAALTQLALALQLQHRSGEAEPLHSQARDMRKMLLGKDHPHTLKSTNHVVSVLWNEIKHEEAEVVGRQTLEEMESALGWGNLATAAIF